MTLPDLQVAIRPDSSFVVDGTGILGTVRLGPLPSGTPFVLGPAGAAFVSLTGQTIAVSIRRGRTRTTDSFDAGRATVTVIDTDGQFNPDNTTSDLYPYVLPLRQFRISATINGTTVALFNGYTTRYTYEYDKGSGYTFVTIEAEDAFRVLNLANITTVTGAALNDPSGTRIGQILTMLSVPTTLRSISTGNTNVSNDSGNLRNGLEAIQQVEATEVGAFYISAEGFYTFKSRQEVQQLQAGTVVTPLVFNETSGLDFTTIQQGLDDDQMFNSVTISGDLISTTTVTDATSISDYFLRSLNRSGSLLTSSSEATDQANFLLASRKTPSLTIDEIGCMPLAMSSADGLSVIGAELLEPITLTKVYGSGTLTRTLTIQQIEHRITPGDWQMRFGLAEPVGGDALVLNSTNSGLLNTNILAY